jgi:UDP-N-acetylmuramoyl-tripeptide--D-alanyl-D-alanine ligase
VSALTAEDIARRAAGVVAAGDPDALATSWSFDSRALTDGACFVALHAERDGHEFVADAFAAGAHVALVDRDVAGLDVGADQAVVRVDDSLSGLQMIATSVRADRAATVVVGVAGSTGKTSTKDLIAAALTSRGCYANVESYNNEFGVPITLLNAPPSAQVIVIEMGERFPGDIAKLCEIARPSIGVVTNVGLAHAEHLGGAEGAAEVLGELLDALPADGLAVLSADDRFTPALAKRTRARTVTVGYADSADYHVHDVELDEALRPSFALGRQHITVPLHGAHHVVNAAMAIAVAKEGLGVDVDEAAGMLTSVRRGRWRMELSETADGVVILNDAYNANPASMEAALRALAHLPVRGRRIAVLGDMRELGDHAPGAHAKIGRRAAAYGIDVVVGVGRGGAAIAIASSDGVDDVRTVANAQEAIETVLPFVAPGDAVLVKASRALGLEVVADALTKRANGSGHGNGAKRGNGS